MAREPRKSKPRRDTYWEHTRRPLHSLVIVAPLLVLFHALETRYDSNLLAPEMMGRFLVFFGATQPFLPPLGIALVLLIHHFARRDPWEVRPVVLAGIVGESILWTVPLIGLSELTGRIAAPAAAATSSGGIDAVLQPALIAVGAGVYEEFVFRMVLISLVVLVFSDVMGLRKDWVVVAAVVCGAALFSLCHFTSQQTFGPDPFAWGKFIFLAVAGVLWGGLFLCRGFAVAVGCHVVWDLYVFAIRM